MSNVIGLCGRAGSGKSVAADALERIGYQRVRFAAPLKDMLRAFFRSCGLAEQEIERRIEGDLKETPDVLLGHKTPRYAMQTLGKEWGRDLICETLWSDAWRARAEQLVANGQSIVAEDVRFSTEVDEVRRLEGTVLEITGRVKSAVDATHATERFAGVVADLKVQNDGTPEALFDAVCAALEQKVAA